MAPNPRVKAAFVAMRAIGITEDKVKPVLKKLLKLYDKNWELIEEENYRALADAIFEDDEKKVEDQKRKSHSEEEEEEAQLQELQPPLKRLRRRNQENQSTATPDNSNLRIGGSAPIQPKQEEELSPSQLALNERSKGKQPISSDSLPLNERRNQSQPNDRGAIAGTLSHGVCIREANVNSHTDQLPKQKLPLTNHLAVTKPKDEPSTEDIPLDEAPLTVIHPEPSGKRISFTDEERNAVENGDVPPSSRACGGNRNGSLLTSQTENHKSSEPANVPLDSANLEIASSSLGEVKLTLSCNSTLGRSKFHMPGLDRVIKRMEDKCLQSYNILDPNFSVMKLMRDMCQCFVELGKDCNDSGENAIDMGQMRDVSPEAVIEDAPSHVDNTANFPVPSVTSDCCKESSQGVEKAVALGSAGNDDRSELAQSGCTDPHGLIPSHRQATTVVKHIPIKGGDITNGEERARISWINEINDLVPPYFHYTPENLTFDGASLSFTLAQVTDGSCCPSCQGDCLSSTMPCACANANGGEFAYSIRGFLKESFIDECIALARDPKRLSHFHCQECPLESSKGGAAQACNGHLKRKFIKECWRKCGCNRCCGNRVVQRGISCRLQVFMTSEGKGWGLRTLDDLPKGAFVCEYIGEILTNIEVHKRNMNTTDGGKMYQVFLDSGWDTTSLKDDEALCLDTSNYANIARFINHRCNDANLIEIPVEVECPKRHYYHLAFFTTRKVQAFEELAWDYGIDFEVDDPVANAFECLCGSTSCRYRKTSEKLHLD